MQVGAIANDWYPSVCPGMLHANKCFAPLSLTPWSRCCSTTTRRWRSNLHSYFVCITCSKLTNTCMCLHVTATYDSNNTQRWQDDYKCPSWRTRNSTKCNVATWKHAPIAEDSFTGKAASILQGYCLKSMIRSKSRSSKNITYHVIWKHGNNRPIKWR